MSMTVKKLVVFWGVVISLSACRFDDQQTKLQYMPDMADSPTVKAQESFIAPPEGAMALTTVESMNPVYPGSFEEADRLTMPAEILSEPDGLLYGKMHYTTFCAVCHGGDGRSKESVIGQWVVAPDLTDEKFVNYSDGEIFYRITFGTSVMPSYGHATDVGERWQIVRYLRELQQN